MNSSHLQTLVKVYNTLLQIHTSGEDSFMMTDCMRIFSNTLMKMAEEEKDKKEE